ncbi:MAG: hypothetical protein JSR83_18180 [Proteobacteria bacterium]|nr:hypothetical protein [Pseudomonadota bacterium]
MSVEGIFSIPLAAIHYSIDELAYFVLQPFCLFHRDFGALPILFISLEN